MNGIRTLLEWAGRHEVLLWWLFAASLAMFLLTPVVVGWLVVRLPADYFTGRRRQPAAWWQRRPLLRPVLLAAKNFAGAVLLLAGLAMLFVPGQGLLTIVVALVLIDFPGKFRLERWLVSRPAVWRSINWFRRRASREPLERPPTS